MAKILSIFPQKLIELSFYLLFFLVPLILTPFNYELFEYNKMMLTYGLTIIIVCAWLIKMITNRRIHFTRTPLDLPLLLFLLSQIISTFLSIDRHVSIWGYYSRFNGGLLSTITYILLYYSFISNFPKEKIKNLLLLILSSGFLVSLYGILEHFGIDKDIWVQDVQNRVFSTLGQPNWLAAYLAVLIPITIGLSLNPKSEHRNSKQSQHDKGILSSRPEWRDLSRMRDLVSDKLRDSSTTLGMTSSVNLFRASDFVLWILIAIFYTTLLFTKSRSGFLGFWIVYSLLFSFIFLVDQLPKLKTIQTLAIASICMVSKKLLIMVTIILIGITFFIGAPFDQINRFTLPALISNQQWTNGTMEQSIKPTGGSIIDVGITESGTIRRIVWQGAIDIFRHYPLFGTGVETFAFSYYKFRPVEHNMTSEWDFLYNKAHNEYLNYAATTGAFGLGSYLLIIVVFIGWNVVKLKPQNSNVKTTAQMSKLERFKILDLDLGFDLNLWILSFGLFSAWLSILITNFFGFSVVVIQLFFFLIPAITFVLTDMSLRTEGEAISKDRHIPTYVGTRDDKERVPINTYQLAIIIFILFVICYLLFILGRLWYADMVFADGYHKVRSQEIAPAYQSLKKALEINEEEPFYYDEFSYPAAEMAVAFNDEKEATLSASLTKEAIIASNFAVNHAPQNVNYWKSRTRVFYVLSQIDEKYYSDSLYSLQQTKILSPTDPKIRYNLGLLYDKMGKKKEAIAELEETTRLKPDYRDAFYALAYLYEKDNKRDKAKESLKYILTKIATDDAEVKKKLEELK